MSTQLQYTVPDVFAPKRIKETKEFAQNVARYILQSTSGYRAKMTARYKNNRDVFAGQQSLQYLRDILQVEENSTYFNVKFTPRPIVKKIVRLIVSGYMKDEEMVNATALSKHIQDKRDRNRLLAKYRMENKEFIDQMSELAGLPLTSSEEFTPESPEELELYDALNSKDLVETLMQDTLTYILNANDIDAIKNLAISELAINNLFGIYETIDASGKPKMYPILAEDCLFGPSYKEDLSDASFHGRYLTMHVADVRRRFNIKPEDEKDFFKALDRTQDGALTKAYGTYMSTWAYAHERPYDKDSVNILHVWWKCAKVYEYVDGTKDGQPYFDFWDYPGYTPNDKLLNVENPRVNYKTPPTAYEGYFLGSGDFALEWKEQENIPYDSAEDEVRSPFRFAMPENTGSMNVDSMVHMIKDSVENMDLIILKIKMLIAKMAPDGYMIDIDSLMDIDLGTGSIINPLDIAQIAKQTGDLFYRGTDEEGNPIQAPVRPNIASSGDKLQWLIATYNFEMDNIRNYLGINEFRDGTANKSRTAAAFAQSQLDQSNMATEFIYRGWARLMTGVVKNMGIRAWYHLKYGETDKGLLRYLGKVNLDFIKNEKDIIATAFDFEYQIVLTKEEKTFLEQTMASAVAEGSLTTEDVILIRQVKNMQVAHKYLTFLSKKRRKERMEEAKANQQSAAEYTAQAGERVEQAKQETVRMAAELEMAKEKTRGENESNASLTKGAMDLLLEYAKAGKDVPEVYQPLINFAIESATNKLQKSNKEISRELQAMDAEDQLAAAEAELNEAVQMGDITEEDRDQVLNPEE